MIPFHYVVNEIYPKQVSRKVRQVKVSNARQGKFNGSQAPYGYEKSPHDTHILIPDEPAASIIRRIFAEFAAGISARAIGNRLNAEGVDSPRFYPTKRLASPIRTRRIRTAGAAPLSCKSSETAFTLGIWLSVSVRRCPIR